MDTVVVMAKAPVAGRVKTRLCPPFAPGEAARLAAAALGDTLAVVDAARCGRRVLALDGTPPSWVPRAFEVTAQADGGLDRRLAAAFAASTGPTVIVGMDTPQVTAELVEHGLAALIDADAVLGPAVDGGYWLLGLADPRPDAVLGVPMSTEHTGAAQRARLLALGLTVADLPELRDVDDAHDAALVAEQAPRTRFAATFRHLSCALERASVTG